MEMPQEEAVRLKEFMLDNFCFDTLKQMKFWPKGTRRDDYAAQAARVCHYFGFEQVYEYGRELREVVQVTDTTAVGSIASTVDASGQFTPDSGFVLHTAQTSFACPHCTKEQEVTRPDRLTHKCIGCKRRLQVYVSINGKVHVTE